MRGIVFRAVVAVATMALVVLMGSAAAAPGDLDTSFGEGGVVTTDVGADDIARGVVVQPDGKIVIAGVSTADTWALVRYLPDGSLDESFGVGGIAVTDAPAVPVYALAPAPDGKLVVVGAGVVARFLPTGALDKSFGTDGLAWPGLGAVTLSDIFVFPDGSMLLGGAHHVLSTSDFLVVRLTADGALDPAFGDGGSVVTDLGGLDAVHALLPLPDGKIVAVGETATTGSEFALVRYLPNGALDPNFGTGGKVVTDIAAGAWDHGDAAVLTTDGKIVVSGASYPNIALARYLADGSLDPAFGTNGIVVAGTGEAWAVAQQRDGRLVVTTGGLAAARFTADGALDGTFGSGGIADAGLPGTGWDVALDNEDRIVVAGTSDHDFAVVRYLGEAGPPANDAFAEATMLAPVMTSPLAGSNVLATKEAGEPPHGSDAGGASVWYAWVPPFSGLGFVSTDGSDFDTTLGVYTGSSVSSLATVAGNDDGRAVNSASLACFHTTAGARYRIAVDGYAAALGYEGAQGDITLSWGEYTGTDPCPTLPPTIAGTPVVGGTLTAANGTWAGEPAGFEFQWLRCRGVPCATIAGATATTYKPTQADVGANLVVRVTALQGTDPDLSAINYSTRTAPVPAPPAPPPSGGGGGGGTALPNLKVTLAASKTVLAPGEESDIVATVANLGGLSSSRTHLLISLPPGMTLLGSPAYELGSGCTGTNPVDCYLDSIARTRSTQVRFAVTMASTGSYSLAATVTTDRESDAADNTAALTLQVTPPTATPAQVVARPVIGKPVSSPARLRAGKRATVRFVVRRSDSGARLTVGRMICDPSFAGRRIQHREQFTNGVATLRFTVPRAAHGKLVKVRLTIRLGSQSSTRISTFRVR